MGLSHAPHHLLVDTVNGHSFVPTITMAAPRAGTSECVRVLIAHADASCRERLTRLLRESGALIVEAVADGPAAVKAARRGTPDLVLVGKLHGLSVAETTRRLTRVAPATPVLVFGTADAGSDLGETLGAGASGYVRIDHRAERLDITVRIAIAIFGRGRQPALGA